MPATVTRRARPLTVLLAALLLAAGVLTPARPVEAAGVTTHAWMAESALDHIENQDLRTLLEANHDNIRAAIDWGSETGAADEVLDLVSSAWRFWQARGHLHEAGQRIESALAMPGASPAKVAKGLEALGGIQWWRGLMEECAVTYSRALAMQRELGESRDLAVALYNHGLASGYASKDFEQAESLFAESEAIFGRLDDEDGLGDIAWGRGNFRQAEGRLEEALALYLDAADRYRRSGNEFGVGWSLFEAGYSTAQLGRPHEAWPLLVDALRLFAGHRDVSGVLMVMFQMGGVARDLGDMARCYRLVGVVDALRHTSGVDIVGIEINSIEGIDLDGLDELTGDERTALEEGRRMGLQDAIEYALAGPIDA